MTVPIPRRMAHLPLDAAGRPIPRFTQFFLEDGTPCDFGEGKPDFRVADSRHLLRCLKHKACWVCGDTLGRYATFAIGPMCLVNMVSSEPPSHEECARYAASACPFLTNPDKVRREAAMSEHVSDVGGFMIPRNPGVTVVLTTRTYRPFKDHKGGILVHIGPPEWMAYYARGRQATQAEVIASIESGAPALYEADAASPNRVIAHKLLDATIEQVINRVKADLPDG